MENKKRGDEEEYHFTEAQESNIYGERGGNQPLQKVNRRGIFVAIGILVVAFSLYKLLGVFWGTKPISSSTTITKPTAVTAAPKPIMPEAKPEVIVPKPVTPPQPKPAAVKSPTVSSPIQATQGISGQLPRQLTDQLSSIQAENQQNQENVTNLQNTISSLSGTMNNLQDSVNNMNQQLQTMNEALQKQQEQFILLTTPKAPPPPPIPAAPIVKKKVTKPRPPPLYLQAIVPGRAWLVRPDGNTITVQVGDVLPGYGRIKTISPVSGSVSTSSGAIIRYRD